MNWLSTKKGRWIIILGLLVVSALALRSLPGLQVDFEFEKLFPKDDPNTRFYEQHVKQFSYDNDFLHLVITRPSGASVFDTSFLQTVQRFEQTVEGFSGVKELRSPIRQKHWIQTQFGWFSHPLLHLKDAESLRKDSVRIYATPPYRQGFSADGKTLMLWVEHEHFADKADGDTLLVRIQRASEQFNLPVRLVGKLAAQAEYISLIQSDFSKFLAGALVLSFAFLCVLYRNVRAALLPFGVSLVTLLWLFGLMAALEVPVNILSALLPPILFFVSMSDSIHLLHAYQKKGSLVEATKAVWKPTALTSATTAIGFLSLLWINTAPIQELGMFCALGILFAFLATYTIGLLLAPKPHHLPTTTRIKIPSAFGVQLSQYSRWIWLVTALLALLAIPGFLQLKVNAYLLEDLPPTSDVRSAFEYVDEAMGGSKPFELRIDISDSSETVWTRANNATIQRVHLYLRDSYGVSRLQSPAAMMQYLHMATNAGQPSAYTWPANERAFTRASNSLSKVPEGLLDPIVTSNERTARFIGFIPEWGSLETGIRNNKLTTFIQDSLSNSNVHFRLTGTTFLIDQSHETLSLNLAKGLLTAVLTIGLFLALYFRSLRLMLISLLPNILPLLLLAGILGWLGIDLKMTTAIIFTMAFGIAVDDTIHLMSHFVQQEASSSKIRLERALDLAGTAIVITTLIVITGFGLFLLSSFGATFYLGLFVCLSLAVAAVLDLTLLPYYLSNSQIMLKKGDQIPQIKLKNHKNEEVDLHSYLGKPFVVYFYPKDDTPGCTAEACSFRDQYDGFKELGAEVIGISRDSVSSHASVVERRRLPFVLLSDPGGRAEKAFGVPRSLLGLLPGRVTFVMDANGHVVHTFNSSIQATRHVTETLAFLQKTYGT